MKQKHFDALLVKRQAHGRWEDILADLAPSVSDATANVGKHVDCPSHPGTTGKNLRVPRKWADEGGMVCNTCGAFPDGYAVLMWQNGWSFGEAVNAVADWLGDIPVTLSLAEQKRHEERQRQKARREVVEKDRARNYLNRVWSTSVSLTHPSAEPARKYLLSRGITLHPHQNDDLRFHQDLTYRDENGKEAGRYPALLARMRASNGTPASILRIYLTRDGRKLPRGDAKKMMTPCNTIKGGAIRIGRPAGTIGVAEGVETALSVTTLHGITCWAAFSATLLAEFEPPPMTEKVIIYADHDRSGTGAKAARTLLERLWSQGIMAAIRFPEGEIPEGRKGVDWNDVLLERAA